MCRKLSPLLLLAALTACGGGSGGDEHAPFISGVLPRWVSATGGTALEIQGNDFTAGQVQVTIDGRPVTDLVVDNPRRIRCTAPAHVAGAPWVADLRVVSEGVAVEAPEALGYIVRLANPEPAADAAFGGTLRTVRSDAGPVGVAGRSLVVADLDATSPPDIAVGVPGRSFGGSDDVGEVLVYFANPDGTFSAPVSIRPPSFPDLAFGFSLAAGDIDGDFVNDLLIGVPGGERADVAISGGPARSFAAPVVLDTHPEAGSQYGFAVALAELDGAASGGREAVIGAPDATAAAQAPEPGGEAGGVVRTLQDGVVTDLLQGFRPFTNLGTSLVSADLDGNSVADVVIGAPGRPVPIGAGPVRSGVIDYLPSDGTAGLPGEGYFPTQFGIFSFTDSNPIVDAEVGAALAAGRFDDLPGEDVLVGMPFDFTGTTLVRGGSARIYYADGMGGVSFALELEDPTPESGARFGQALTPGDFDGDGVLDAAVAAPLARVGSEDAAGRVALFFGDRTQGHVVYDATLTEPVPEQSARFGVALASGDFNGDGRDDLVVSCRGSDQNLGASGEVFVFFQPARLQGP